METNSKEFDTIRLLQECDAGSKMAVSAIDEVLDRTQGSTLKNLLLDTKQHHAKLGNDIHTELAHCHGNTKEPSPVAKGMAWAKTNMKLTLEQRSVSTPHVCRRYSPRRSSQLFIITGQYRTAAPVKYGSPV